MLYAFGEQRTVGRGGRMEGSALLVAVASEGGTMVSGGIVGAQVNSAVVSSAVAILGRMGRANRRGFHNGANGVLLALVGCLCLRVGVTPYDWTELRPHASHFDAKSPSAIGGANLRNQPTCISAVLLHLLVGIKVGCLGSAGGHMTKLRWNFIYRIVAGAAEVVIVLNAVCPASRSSCFSVRWHGSLSGC